MAMDAHEGGAFDDVQKLEQSHLQQQVAEILKQSEGLSKEELAAEIIRHLCTQRVRTYQEFADLKNDHKEPELQFKHPMGTF